MPGRRKHFPADIRGSEAVFPGEHQHRRAGLAYTFCGLLALASCASPALATPGAAREIELAYIGDAADPAYGGVSQGLEEANLQGQFLGQRYRLTIFKPGAIREAANSKALAVLATLKDADLVRLAAMDPQRAVFDLGSESDAIREKCAPNLLHVLPSAKMKADALAQWHRLHPESRAEARAWHPEFTKYAAEQLNRRFRKAQGRDMGDPAWAAWAAVKMIADSVARMNTAEPARLLHFLKTELAFDGQKGVTMSFRPNGQLRQILLIVEGARIVGEAPVKGMVDATDLDSIGDLGSVACPISE